ncbi:MAG: hypothetical protein U0350_20920 [Caldilineaceae bacterium]
MTTAVVVTSIVTTNLGEAKFVDHILEQIRRNDRDLLNKLAKVDVDARVVTAILNVNEFMSYANEWLRQQQTEKKPTKKRRTAKRADPALFKRPEEAKPSAGLAQSNGMNQTTVVNQAMSEGEFMEYTLAQLRQGNVQPFSSFSAEAAEQMEDEPIGEDFSRQPFLY